MRTTKHAPRGSCHFLEHPHALADIVQRGAVSAVERLSVQLFKCERESMSFSESASGHGDCFQQQCLSFFEATERYEVIRVVAEITPSDPHRLTMQTLTTKLDNSSILKDAREAAEMAA